MLDRDMSNYKAIKITGNPWIANPYTSIPEGSTYRDVMLMMDNVVQALCKQLRYDAYYPHCEDSDWHHSGLFCNVYTTVGKVCVGVSYS